MATAGADGSRIARLPRALRGPAAAAQRVLAALGRLRSSPYVFEADGMATAWHSPFLADETWQARYDEMARDWFSGGVVDVRWRMWILTELARRMDGLGAFAEFGTNRGGCAYMMLATTQRSALHMFDTFAGIPDANLTDEERAAGFAGSWADTSVEHVRRRLGEWPERTRFWVGDVFETLQTADTGELALVHMDLNAAAATRRALQYALPRLRAGGLIVFDDYGFTGYEDQRAVVDAFFAGERDRPVALPTGQALLLKTA
ncbi:MAG TPA: TylF/MycF/NovP-related O-methyltransferase [Solirubrobacteraceae bacterium]|jgi:O-methyltransferase|nr:TylF/MycF/NovP-related O-methyltransferase [Solirubrobacteraceae bacterium]